MTEKMEELLDQLTDNLSKPSKERDARCASLIRTQQSTIESLMAERATFQEIADLRMNAIGRLETERDKAWNEAIEAAAEYHTQQADQELYVRSNIKLHSQCAREIRGLRRPTPTSNEGKQE